MKKQREFIDQDHVVMDKYYQVFEDGLSRDRLYSKMEEFIQDDPDFFDPYLIIYDGFIQKEQYEEANELLVKGYDLAIKRICDKHGNFPDVLEWGWLENRHIIRIILKRGLVHWQHERNDKALEIFKKLLNSNPRDNIGVRYYILAILEKMTYQKYESRFEYEGFLSDEIFSWFDKEKKKYSEEFRVLESLEDY